MIPKSFPGWPDLANKRKGYETLYRLPYGDIHLRTQRSDFAFDGITNQSQMPVQLKLEQVKRLHNDLVWLRYMEILLTLDKHGKYGIEKEESRRLFLPCR